MSRWHPGLKVPRQQGFNVTLFVTVDDSGEDAGDVGMRFRGIQFAGFDQGGEHGPILGSGLVARKQGIFAV